MTQLSCLFDEPCGRQAAVRCNTRRLSVHRIDVYQNRAGSLSVLCRRSEGVSWTLRGVLLRAGDHPRRFACDSRHGCTAAVRAR